LLLWKVGKGDWRNQLAITRVLGCRHTVMCNERNASREQTGPAGVQTDAAQRR
jgi:hypothetical protein